MSEYNAKNYTEQGGEVTHVDGRLQVRGVLDYKYPAKIEGWLVEGWISRRIPENDSVSILRSDFINLVDLLKFGHIIIRDTFDLIPAITVNDTDPANADRQYNTSKVTGATFQMYPNVLMITLSEKVENLKDFDAGDKGVHKWLGIGLSDKSVTGSIQHTISVNGKWLTAEDVAEAYAVGLGLGYFVLWIPADEIKAGVNNLLYLEGNTYEPSVVKIVILEPED